MKKNKIPFNYNTSKRKVLEVKRKIIKNFTKFQALSECSADPVGLVPYLPAAFRVKALQKLRFIFYGKSRIRPCFQSFEEIYPYIRKPGSLLSRDHSVKHTGYQIIPIR